MATTQYYVYSVDTSTGTTYQVHPSTWNGPGTKVGGPFATVAAAQAFIKANPQALNNTVLQQDQSQVGYWIVVPEGEAGKITQALAYTGNNPLTAVVGVIKDNLAVGGDVTVSQLTSAQQVQNAELANITLYPTQAAAQAQANSVNGVNNPNQGATWEQALENLASALSSASFWIRATKVVVGGTLLIVGVAKLTGADQKFGGALKTATKFAPLI
jgi:hypothetical protein